jgi:hypothetical protein
MRLSSGGVHLFTFPAHDDVSLTILSKNVAVPVYEVHIS